MHINYPSLALSFASIGTCKNRKKMPKQTVLIELRKGEKANGYITMKGMLRDTPKDRAKTCVKKLKPSTASQTLKKEKLENDTGIIGLLQS